MSKYLLKVSYTVQGTQGLKKEGGTARKDVVEKLAADMGGSIEAFYFAFGDDDLYVIADFPSDEAAAALSLTVGASGAVRVSTIPLLTADQVDAAARMDIAYRPPGA
ncbi:MAG: GYD domain-containing protein [Actinomycetota bacterium]|nr:GYD domain-containing protein [Actinomycetota bacterium]